MEAGVLLLLRLDRKKLAAEAASHELVRSQPKRRFSGVGLPWYTLECTGIRLRLNGVVALADGVLAKDLADPTAEVWVNLERRLPLLARTKRQVIALLDREKATSLEALEYYAGAVDLLDRVMTFALSRPEATAREITACERWLHGRLTQYMTGRGALRNVVLPWRTWLERYEYLLRTVEGALDELELPPEGPLLELSRDLTLITTQRDRRSIIHEYRTRLGDLTDACNRVAAEIGVIGTFGSLALVPFESTLGLLFLAPVVLAGSAYYGGHSLARAMLMRPRRRLIKPSPTPKRRTAIPNPSDRPSLAKIIPRLVQHPVHIIASVRLSAADVACAVEIRHQILERTTCVDPLDAISLGTHDDRDKIRVVIGGPLVRPNLDPFVAPECDLTDSRGHGWEIVAGEQRIVHCDDDETVGCCAVGWDARTLFLFGVRDAGTVVVTRWLAGALDDLDIGGAANWVALRRGTDDQPEEVARG